MHAYNGSCYRNVVLGEICINHTDCHGIEPGPSRLECILGECKCQSEYVEHYGFCSSDGFRTSNIVELTLLCIVVVCWFIFSETVVVAWIALALAIFYMFWIMIIGNYFFDNNNYMWRPERND
ncbi:uncharacterized protein LOC115887380 [Sitophilus oryzae]|uniref:Uncharacterized protein LOC115887380 n=1 Tax=Sitophilus oryzae TaxID=7048 RepID=A0A6J2YHQ8_SITOR|nr:uncharacterized protein LOC115887380 [Sitophilus oryzae]